MLPVITSSCLKTCARLRCRVLPVLKWLVRHGGPSIQARIFAMIWRERWNQHMTLSVLRSLMVRSIPCLQIHPDGQVDTLSPDTSRPEIINLARLEQAIEAQKFHYIGLGDRHSLTEVGSTGRVRYSGAPVATAFDEIDPNKALLVQLQRDGDCIIEPLVVGNWSFIAKQQLMNSPEDLAHFERWLNSLPNKECTVVKVGFEGSVNLATIAALDELMESKSEVFASLRRRERTTNLTVVPDGLDQDSVSLFGYARETWNELLELSNKGDLVAQDALRLLYRFSTRDGME